MKNKFLSIRISDDDLEAIHRKAEQAHLSVTDYVTKCCLKKQITVIEDLNSVLKEEKAIGNNLNQLTLLSHMGKIKTVNFEKLTEQFVRLNSALSKVLERKRW